MKTKEILRRCRAVLLCVIVACCATKHTQAQQVNQLYISMLDYSYNCQTGMATVKYHITNSDPSGNTGGYNTSYTINFGVYSVSGFIGNGDDDVEATAGYIIGDVIEIRAYGVGNNFTYPMSFAYQGYMPKPVAPDIWMLSPATICSGQSFTINASGSNGNYLWSNGQTGPSITVTEAGTYTVQAIGSCGNSDPSNSFTVIVNNAPAAPSISSSNGTLLCNGVSTTLSSSSSGGTINWSNGSSGTSTSVTAAGSYYATETNGCGTSTASNTITINTSNSPSAPSVSSSNGTSLCNGQSTTLSAAPTAGGTLTWNTGNTGGSISVNAPGDYYVSESNGCGTGPNSNVVTITTGALPAAPVISSSNGTLLCNDTSTALTASGGGSISWNNGASGATISVSAAGTYYATASNSCGTSANSNAIVLSTNVTPSAPSVSASGTLLCNGASATLSSSPSFGGSIQWNTGQGGNSISVNGAGNYYAYETNGCGNSANSNVVSIATASTPAAPTVTPSGTQQLCNGASVTLSSSGSDILWSNGQTGNTISTSTAGNYYTVDRNVCGSSTASNAVNVTTVVCPTPLPGSSFFVCPGALKTLDAGAGYDTYQWSNGATTQTIAVGPGTYTVTVSRQGCFATSAAVTVGYYTVTTPTIGPSGATTFCAGNSINLTASAGNVYSWNTGATAQSINVTSSGAYYVTVTDGNGCQATSNAVNVSVNPLPSASITGGGTVCQNGAAQTVTFTGSGGVAPYTFGYKINSGSTQIITTTSGNSVSISVPTSASGSFVYSLVSVQESSSTSCTNAASGSVTVTVNALPTATITGTTTVCRNSVSPSITFTASNGSAPFIFSYRINGGSTQVITASSGNSVSLAVPTNSAGTYTYSLVGVQEAAGCVNAASGNATITINPLPGASITGTTSVCQGSVSPNITFTGSNGVAPYTFTYKINGGASQTITTSSGNSVTLPVPTTTPGNYLYSLVSVQDASTTACTNAASGDATVTINALPTATISGNATLCRNSASPAISFTGANGVAPYTFSYKINGGELQTITTSTGNTASVQAPTDAAGTFVYTLISVQDASNTSCSNTANGTATIVINPLPTAVITGNTIICQNGPAPVITFTGSGATAPYTFEYRINSGSLQTITSSGNTTTINAPTDAPGSFTYTLISVKESSATTCTNAASGNITVVVKSQPVKALITTSNTHLCNGEYAALKVTNYVSGQTYVWYKDGSLLRTSSNDTIRVTVAGNYTVMAVSVDGCAAASMSDAITITTGTVTTPVITGSLKVCEGGKSLLAAVNDRYDKWWWTDPPRGQLLAVDSSFFAYAGQYRVRVEMQGCFDSTQVTVTANDTEFPAGELKINKSVIAYGDAVELFADVKGAVNYQWDLGNGTKFDSKSNRITETYYLNGDSIPIKLAAISERNCITRFTTYVSVGAMDKKSITDNSFTGIVKDWNVFPIPFHQEIKITAVLERSEAIRFDLFTADGKWIKSWTASGQKGDNLFTVDLSMLKDKVMYFITGYYNGQRHSDKIYKY